MAQNFDVFFQIRPKPLNSNIVLCVLVTLVFSKCWISSQCGTVLCGARKRQFHDRVFALPVGPKMYASQMPALTQLILSKKNPREEENNFLYVVFFSLPFV